MTETRDRQRDNSIVIRWERERTLADESISRKYSDKSHGIDIEIPVNYLGTRQYLQVSGPSASQHYMLLRGKYEGKRRNRILYLTNQHIYNIYRYMQSLHARAHTHQTAEEINHREEVGGAR